MTVTDNTTLIEDHETAPSYTNIGTGQGPGQNANFPLIGSNCSARKIDNATYPNGFFFNPGAAFDLSSQGEHVLFWIQCITASLFTDFGVRIGSATTAYEEHNNGVSFYPVLGGYTPIWFQVDTGTDTGTPDFTACDEFAIICAMGNISQNLQNFHVDQNRHSVRPCLQLDGSSVSIDDVVSDDVTNRYGVAIERDGVIYLFGNFQWGSSTATTSTDTNKKIAAPDATQLPEGSDWLGIDFDLQNASTNIDATALTYFSGNATGATARKPDILVTGTSGTLTLASAVLDGMRRLKFSSGVSLINSSILNSGQIDPSNGDYTGEMALSGTDEYIDTQENIDLNTTSGDFEIIMLVNATDWTPASTQTLASHYGGSAATASFRFQLNTSGQLVLIVSDGATEETLTGNALGFRDGWWAWVRVTYDQSAGQANFFASEHFARDTPAADVTWTAFGTPSGTSRSMPTNSRPLLIGAENDGTPANFFIGSVAYFELWTDGFKATGGSLGDLISRADWRTGPDFTGSPATRVDDFAQSTLTWEEQGTSPTYTQGSDESTAADFDGATITDSTSESALLWNINADPDGEMDNMTFNSSGTGHAIELGPLTPSSISLRAHTYAGYAGSDGSTGNETIFNNSGKAITINVLESGDSPTIRNGTGASTTVDQSVTITVTIRDDAGTAIANARVAVYTDDASETQLMNELTNVSGVATESFAYSSDQAVFIRVRAVSGFTPPYRDVETNGTITSSGLTVTVTLEQDDVIDC